MELLTASGTPSIWGSATLHDILVALATTIIIPMITVIATRLYTIKKRNEVNYFAALRAEFVRNARNPVAVFRTLRNKPVLHIGKGSKAQNNRQVSVTSYLVIVSSFLIITIVLEGLLLFATYKVDQPIEASEIRLLFQGTEEPSAQAIPEMQGCRWDTAPGDQFTSVLSAGLCIDDESGDSRSISLESNTGSTFFKFDLLPSGVTLRVNLSRSSNQVPTETVATMLAIVVTPDRGVLRVPISNDIPVQIFKTWVTEIDCLATLTGIVDEIDPTEGQNWTGCTGAMIENNLGTAGNVLRRGAQNIVLRPNQGSSPWSGDITSTNGDSTGTIGVREVNRLSIGYLYLLAAGMFTLMILSMLIPAHDEAEARIAASNIAFGLVCSAGARDAPEFPTFPIVSSRSEISNKVAHVGVRVPDGYYEAPIEEGDVVESIRAFNLLATKL